MVLLLLLLFVVGCVGVGCGVVACVFVGYVVNVCVVVAYVVVVYVVVACMVGFYSKELLTFSSRSQLNSHLLLSLVTLKC